MGHLLHWRNKVCKDFRAKVEGTAAEDLLVVEEQYEGGLKELDDTLRLAADTMSITEAGLVSEKVLGTYV